MKFDIKKPCDDCPFRREGGIRLRRSRAEEIAEGMLSSQGSTFACHKTVDHDGDQFTKSEEKHCAGALIFAEKNGTATQMMRIVERLGMYDASKLVGHDDVFNDLDEMLEVQEQPAPKHKRRARAWQPQK